jgi:hypothetical protein
MLVITAAGTGMTGAAADPNPSIDLSESTGPVGTVFAANSCGWLENLPIQVSQTGLEEMGPPQENKSDNYGCFNKTFRVKNDTPPGYVTIEYRQAERIRTQANFEVQGR